MKTILACLCVFAIATVVRAEPKEDAERPAALDFKVKSLDGKEVDLAEKYAGKVVLLVNVASECGLTPQYEELQALHEEYADEGLAIVGVPSNQFGAQEPGTAEEIADFCAENYGVEFDLLEKVNVKSDEDDQAPLYKFLTSEETNPEFAGNITWNFEKFVIGRNGEVVARFKPRTKPDDPEVLKTLKAELEKPEK
ncbi:MAG: glutathione peroxidase [Pirellulales bacterium]